MNRFTTYSTEETAELGYALGQMLQKGDVVCLNGDLGTGKTVFASGVAEALGIKGYITSPTFTIVNEYKGELPLYHFDVYRISDPDEMFEIGFDEYLNGEGITVIEWAELISEVIPKEYVMVDLGKEIENGISFRKISIRFLGDRYRGYENRLTEFIARKFRC